MDAENIGSMGLPIILVCKIEDDKVVKITDGAEWQQAKNYLKGIIAGNTMTYVPVTTEMAADEVYYTQLTLPVASFEVIKNAYKVEEVSPVVESAPIVESVPAIEPVIPEVPVAPAVPEASIEPASPVIDIEIPTASEPVVEPVIPEVSEEPKAEATPVIPEVPEIPVNNTVEGDKTIDFSESKEAFMKACENMFDALVAKFQSELDSKK